MPLKRTPPSTSPLMTSSLLLIILPVISMHLCIAIIINSTQVKEYECSTLLQLARQAPLFTNCNCTQYYDKTSLKLLKPCNGSCVRTPPPPWQHFARCTTAMVADGGGHDVVTLVRELYLSNMGLSGNLKWITNFKHIKHLDVSRNNFSGNLPASMWRLAELTHINLSFNNLNAYIPNFNYSKSSSNYPLKALDLSHNHIGGPFPRNLCTRFPNLTQIILGSNNLTGSANLSLCAKLEALDASSNRLQGSLLMETLKAKSSLKIIDLKNNMLNGSVPSLSGSPHLAYFDISFNHFSGIFGSEYDELPVNLSKINVSHNNLEVGFSTHIIFSIGLSSFWPNKACKGCGVMAPSPSPSAISVHAKNCTNAPHSPWFSQKKSRFSEKAEVDVVVGILVGSVATFIFITIICCVVIRKRRRKMKWPLRPKRLVPSPFKHAPEIGPFSFEAQSGTWIADVKDPSSIPVVIFGKPLMNLTFADLLQATGSFNKESEVGDGMGLVYVCALPGVLEADAKVTIEVVEDGRGLSAEAAHAAFSAMGEVKHENVVPLLGYCIVGEEKLLIFKHVEGGSLEDVLHAVPERAPLPESSAASTDDWHNMESWPDYDHQSCVIDTGQPSIDWETRLKIALGITRALAYLHNGYRRPVVHGAVSSSCILLDQVSKEAFLANYGSGWGLHRRLQPGYVAPECQQSAHAGAAQHSSKCDVYGMGVVLLELATGRHAVGNYGVSEASLVAWVRGVMKGKKAEKAVDPRLPSSTHTHLLEMLKLGYLCTADSPSKRPSIQQVVGLLKDIAPH